MVALKRPGSGFEYATPETVVTDGDVLIVAGKITNTERFSELT